MSGSLVTSAILRFNAGRDPRRLKLKYAAMRESPFAFLRGSCHLFYRTLPHHALLTKAPKAWISGDLHFENFGSYRADNRRTYFDLNDFEEACLAPCTWELLRFLASVLVGGSTLELGEAKAAALCRRFLNAFRMTLINGEPGWIERSLAKGMVRDLLEEVEGRKRRKFLDKRTKRKGNRRKIRIDGEKALEISKARRRMVTRMLESFARTRQDPRFYRVLDAADRVAGLGSLGVERYVVLVEGRGSPNGNFLIDIKEARPSAVAAAVPARQPAWPDHGARVATVQRMVQAESPALLAVVTVRATPFVLKELQPGEDRVNLKSWNGNFRKLEIVMQSMGEVVAWGQLRAAGRRGAGSREELRDFAKDGRWVRQILELATRQRRTVIGHWKEYAIAYDRGKFS